MTVSRFLAHRGLPSFTFPLQNFAMRHHLCLTGISLAAVAILSTGCLSIGGRTYSDSPETAARLSAPEARVGPLEHAISAVSAAPAFHVEAVPGGRPLE
jgi:hypothetical protein